MRLVWLEWQHWLVRYDLRIFGVFCEPGALTCILGERGLAAPAGMLLIAFWGSWMAEHQKQHSMLTQQRAGTKGWRHRSPLTATMRLKRRQHQVLVDLGSCSAGTCYMPRLQALLVGVPATALYTPTMSLVGSLGRCNNCCAADPGRLNLSRWKVFRVMACTQSMAVPPIQLRFA